MILKTKCQEVKQKSNEKNFHTRKGGEMEKKNRRRRSEEKGKKKKH